MKGRLPALVLAMFLRCWRLFNQWGGVAMIQEILQDHDRSQLIDLLLAFGPMRATFDQQLLCSK